MPVTLIKRLLGLGASSAAKNTYPHPAEELLPPHLIKDLREGTWRQLKYPPFQEGFPARKRGRDLMFLLQPELVTRIRASLGFSDEMFEKYVEPILVNFADLVHLLPASENDHHNGPGGLIKHCLEVANFALDGCLTAAFDANETPSNKSARTLRWRLAGMAAGLLHDAGKALTDMRVMDFKGEIRWSYTEGSIYEWSERENITRYFIYWNNDRHENHKPESAALTTKIIPPHVETWLTEYGRDIYTDMLKAVQGIPSKSRLTELVIKADCASVDLDKRKGPSGGETGVPVTRLVTDTMLRLKEIGTWEPNKLGGRIWVATNGIFIAWNTGAQEIVDLLVSEGITAIPRSPDTLIGILADTSIAERTPDGDLYWLVAPHLLRKNGKGPALKCLKLTNNRILYPHGDLPEPISISLGREGDQEDFLAPGEAGSVATLASPQPAAAVAPDNQDEQPKPAKTKEKKSPKAAPPAPPAPENPSVPSLSSQPSPALQAEPEDTTEQADLDVQEASIEDLLMVLSPRQAYKPADDVTDEKPGKSEESEPASSVKSGHESNSSPSIQTAPPAQPTRGKVSLSALLGQAEPAKPDEHQAKRPFSLSQIMSPEQEQLANPEPILNDDAAPEVKQTALPLSDSPLPAPVAIELAVPQKQVPEQAVLHKPATEQSDPQPGCDLPADIRGKLTEAEVIRLNSNPDLTRKLLAACQDIQNLRVVYNKIFVPYHEHSLFSRDDLPALLKDQWIWQDFTSEGDDGLEKTINKRTGFVFCEDLSLIISKITGEFSQIQQCHHVTDTDLPAWQVFVDTALSLSSRECLGRVETFFLTFAQFDDACAKCGLEPADGERALYSLRDTVRVARRRRYYIRARREEYIKK